VDPSQKVPDINCEVQDLLLEVVDLKQEVPDLRSGGIPSSQFNRWSSRLKNWSELGCSPQCRQRTAILLLPTVAGLPGLCEYFRPTAS